MAANFGGVVVANLTARIERACQTGNVEHAAGLLIQLQPAATELWRAIGAQLTSASAEGAQAEAEGS
jgi:hypothetical protein